MLHLNGKCTEELLVCSWGQEKNKVAAQELATMLLSMPAPSSVQQQTKSLLASLHTSRSAYHNHKVRHCKDFSDSCNFPVYGWGAACLPPCSVNLLATFPSAPAACIAGFCVSSELHCLKCFLTLFPPKIFNLGTWGSWNTWSLQTLSLALVSVSTGIWLRVIGNYQGK